MLKQSSWPGKQSTEAFVPIPAANSCCASVSHLQVGSNKF